MMPSTKQVVINCQLTFIQSNLSNSWHYKSEWITLFLCFTNPQNSMQDTNMFRYFHKNLNLDVNLNISCFAVSIMIEERGRLGWLTLTISSMLLSILVARWHCSLSSSSAQAASAGRNTCSATDTTRPQLSLRAVHTSSAP